MAAPTTYAELQTKATQWMVRSDLLADMPEYITYAENDINAMFRGRTFKTDTTLTGTVGSRYIDLPSDYVEWIGLFLTTYGDDEELTPLMAGTFPYDYDSAPPEWWSIDGTQIALDHPCDVAHTFRFRYRQKLALSDSAPTNWLLTNFPMVYITGTCHWASMFVYRGDPVRSTTWERAFDKALERVDWNESRSEYGKLRADAALLLGRKFDIQEGDY